MFCTNKWCHPGWLNQYICINLQFLAACSRGCLLLWNLTEKQIITIKKKKTHTIFFFSQVKTFSSLSKHNSTRADCAGGKTSHGLGSSPRLSIWWDCKPQGQSSAPVSSDPWAGMFSRYNLGFSSHSFPNPTLTERSLLLFPSIVAFLRVWVEQCEIRKLQFEERARGLWFLVVFTLQGGHFSIDSCWK